MDASLLKGDLYRPPPHEESEDIQGDGLVVSGKKSLRFENSFRIAMNTQRIGTGGFASVIPQGLVDIELDPSALEAGTSRVRLLGAGV